MKSIVTDNLKCCFICGSNQNIEVHHCIYGTGRRKLSDKYGLVVCLCYSHHRGTFGVHGKNGHELDLKLKQQCQKAWEYQIGTREQFIMLFGRNYL